MLSAGEVIGHGVDLVAIDSIRALVRREGEDLFGAYLTDLEIELATKAAVETRARFLAGRIAAKEAVAKALGTGMSGDMTWLDIEIGAAPTGALSVWLSGDARRVADGLGIESWFVSISHAGSFAIASAIATRAGQT